MAVAVVVAILVAGLFHGFNCKQSLCYYHDNKKIKGLVGRRVDARRKSVLRSTPGAPSPRKRLAEPRYIHRDYEGHTNERHTVSKTKCKDIIYG
ncbi:uncharacterized protein ASPGLDRAFT_1061501 [Aspergillus glaucus CBS 516.65]|uniref:Secreted protein n=1 Tax=Aspergillus glaucus CBS 516.65 TaxID=1160497 RepID=A0A1L9V5U6_ASPGL|nr:hypothetical protein ASPGLDRAFT_1061501 [Aspergillus glaucus CBS 516.65]OJJ79249.1 hypothetical protein ASPGLDRAFT_1061501 [Aspergillus glaucus CBS 516.65]